MAVNALTNGESLIFDPRVVAHRVGHFVSGILSSPNLGDRLSEAEVQRRHDENVTVGRLQALTILQRRAQGLPMDIYNRDGKVVYNLWNDFRSLPGDVTYPEMRLNDDQIASLEEKAKLERKIE